VWAQSVIAMRPGFRQLAGRKSRVRRLCDCTAKAPARQVAGRCRECLPAARLWMSQPDGITMVGRRAVGLQRRRLGEPEAQAALVGEGSRTTRKMELL
jgi:hypothetical protein